MKTFFSEDRIETAAVKLIILGLRRAWTKRYNNRYNGQENGEPRERW